LKHNVKQFFFFKISSKLNFPTNQPVFKNLTKLYDEDGKNQESARKMIQKSAKKVERSRKSNETRDEIEELVNGLVDLEYIEDDANLMTPTLNKLYSEDDFLGISKFAAPRLMSSKRNETQRYIESLEAEVSRDFFQSDEYLIDKKWQQPEANSDINQSDKECKCLQDFYTNHSKCS
jgi:hypothetical protein